MHVAVYDRHWATLGGGEQVGAHVALALEGHADVTLLGWGGDQRPRLHDRLGTDLTRCTWREVTTEDSVTRASADYDVFVNVSYESTASCMAPRGIYYVHFPSPLRSAPGAASRARRLISRALAPIPRGALGHRTRRLIDDHAHCSHRIEDVLPTYGDVIANSGFVADCTAALWERRAEVIAPPVEVPPIAPRLDRKEHRIVALGRFMDPVIAHSKAQLDLVKAFRSLVGNDPGARGWRLVLIGGCGRDGRSYLQETRGAAQGLDIEFLIDTPRSQVLDQLRRASILWHGAGLGVDAASEPQKVEHFGIALVEAMGHSVAPVVVGVGGPAEIVRTHHDGVHVHRWNEFASQTSQLIADPAERERLALNARARALDFSVTHFHERIRRLVGI